ncbi:MAG: hypothetical protein R3250_05300 [Melioribacteraceae bacterium]|nr:hypothetical protein [Melioribacteraceae bacterium]
MDDLNKPEEPTEDPIEEIVEEEEYGLTDKIVAVLSEPGTLFTKLSDLPVKTVDWLLPVLLVIVAAIAMQFVAFSNPEIRAELLEKQLEQMEQSLQESVDSGQISQEQADQQLEQTAQFMERGGSLQLIFGAIGTVIVVFLVFFIVAGVFMLVSKSALGGTGTYKASMLAYGMPHYIAVIQIIIMIVLSILFGRLFQDASVGSFMGMEKEGIVGWFMHKLDPLSFWFYSVVGIAYAKMFKSDSTAKYVITILAMWLGFSLLFHFLAEAVPFLKMFGM